MRKYFDIIQDKTLSHFCEACLVGKHEDEISPDFRYCQACYDLLLEEVEMLSGGRRPAWSPKPQKPKIAGEKQYYLPEDIEKQKGVLLHTKTVPAHAYQNPTEDRPKVNLGGRPRKDVPIKLIHKLSQRGLSIGRIVKELKGQGQIISAMTIQRVLSGEREPS